LNRPTHTISASNTGPAHTQQETPCRWALLPHRNAQRSSPLCLLAYLLAHVDSAVRRGLALILTQPSVCVAGSAVISAATPLYRWISDSNLARGGSSWLPSDSLTPYARQGIAQSWVGFSMATATIGCSHNPSQLHQIQHMFTAWASGNCQVRTRSPSAIMRLLATTCSHCRQGTA
jgi:hypothetical protein